MGSVCCPGICGGVRLLVEYGYIFASVLGDYIYWGGVNVVP